MSLREALSKTPVGGIVLVVSFALTCIAPVCAQVPVADSSAMSMTHTAGQTLDAWHFHAGVPFAKGALRDASQFTLYRDGKTIPAQARAVATWGPKGSVKWLAVDFVDGIEANRQNQYTFRIDVTANTQVALRVDDKSDHIAIDNSRLNLRINKAAKGFNLFESVTLDGRDVWSAADNIGPVPILPPTEKVWLETGDKVTASISGFKYFYVPADCESFELAFLPDYTKDRFYQKLNMATGAILNPDVKPVASISCGLETEPQVLTTTVPAKHRGNAWCIAGSGYALVRMTGVPPYISPALSTFATAPHTPTP